MIESLESKLINLQISHLGICFDTVHKFTIQGAQSILYYNDFRF